MMRKLTAGILSLTFIILSRATFVSADGPSGAPPTGSAQSAPSLTMNLVPMMLIFGIIYFLMIRPQQKKMKDQQQMLGALKNGDDVVTASGMLGKVTGVTEKVVTVEIADNVRIKMLKSQISQIVKGQIKDLA